MIPSNKIDQHQTASNEIGNLVLGIQPGDRIKIGAEVEIEFFYTKLHGYRLRINAPKSLAVARIKRESK